MRRMNRVLSSLFKLDTTDSQNILMTLCSGLFACIGLKWKLTKDDRASVVPNCWRDQIFYKVLGQFSHMGFRCLKGAMSRKVHLEKIG